MTTQNDTTQTGFLGEGWVSWFVFLGVLLVFLAIWRGIVHYLAAA